MSISSAERRRSPRHLVGAAAEIHIGPKTVLGIVHDVSAHGMGLVLPSDTESKTGDLIWILAQTVCPYAITATIVRHYENGTIGVEFEEVLSGDNLAALESLSMDSEPGDEVESAESSQAFDPSDTSNLEPIHVQSLVAETKRILLDLMYEDADIQGTDAVQPAGEEDGKEDGIGGGGVHPPKISARSPSETYDRDDSLSGYHRSVDSEAPTLAGDQPAISRVGPRNDPEQELETLTGQQEAPSSGSKGTR